MKAKRDANGSGRERKMNNDIDGKRRQLVQRLKIWGYKDTKKYMISKSLGVIKG